MKCMTSIAENSIIISNHDFISLKTIESQFSKFLSTKWECTQCGLIVDDNILKQIAPDWQGIAELGIELETEKHEN